VVHEQAHVRRLLARARSSWLRLHS
jgi:hypothetical protein